MGRSFAGSEPVAGSAIMSGMSMRRGTWVGLSLGLLAFAACSVAPEPAEAGRDSGRDVGTAPADLAPTVDAGGPLAWPTGKYISVDEVYRRLQAQDPDMLLVNVVDEEFYDLGHLPGSLKIPWDTLAGRLGELDRARHIVIYCRRGVRSESAYTTLTGNGFSLVWMMEGGIEPWIAAGYPVVPD